MRDEVKAIMASVFRTDIKNITDGLKQEDVNFWDSLKHLTLIVALEERYKVTFEPEEIAEMISIDKLIFCLNQKIKK